MTKDFFCFETMEMLTRINKQNQLVESEQAITYLHQSN